jgi:hypothetical protein
MVKMSSSSWVGLSIEGNSALAKQRSECSDVSLTSESAVPMASGAVESVSESSSSMKDADIVDLEVSWELSTQALPSTTTLTRTRNTVHAHYQASPSSLLFSARSLPVQEYCKLILSAEVVEDGNVVLKKVVFMPLDPDVLLWILKSKHSFPNSSYSRLNTRHSFEQVHKYAMDQARRQIFYFSQMLKKDVFSKEELVQKIGPYMTVDTGKRVFARVMYFDGVPVIGSKGETEREMIPSGISAPYDDLLMQRLSVHKNTLKES